MLRCIAGLEKPEEGEIRLGGETLFSSKDKLFIPPNKRDIGMVFQSYAIWPHMSVFENVAYPLKVKRLPRSEIKKKVKSVLTTVGLEGLEDRPAPQLSGGQQQRVALARALAIHPEVLQKAEQEQDFNVKVLGLRFVEL
jgi:iron(III) transport system ATP-binding protein